MRDFSGDDVSDDGCASSAPGEDVATDVAVFGGSDRARSEADVDVPLPPPDPVGERPTRKRRELKPKSETLQPVPDNRRDHNANVEDQSHLERIFAAYFAGYLQIRVESVL